MVSGYKVRLFTNDQYVLDKVIYNNFYRTKQFDEGDVVVDIGAHVGYYSIWAVLSGAKMVYAFEPFKPNFETLVENTRDFRERIDFNNIAILHQDSTVEVNLPEFQERGKLYDFNSVELEQTDKPSHAIPSWTLDTALEKIKEDKVRLVKINIGAYELDVLQHSKMDKVQNVVGEAYGDVDFPKVVDAMKEKGFTESWVKPTEENTQIFIFSKEKAEDLFEIYL